MSNKKEVRWIYITLCVKKKPENYNTSLTNFKQQLNIFFTVASFGLKCHFIEQNK